MEFMMIKFIFNFIHLHNKNISYKFIFYITISLKIFTGFLTRFLFILSIRVICLGLFLIEVGT